MKQQLPPPIKDAAHNYATHNYFESDQIRISKISFEAGAEWQKEQYNPLIDEVNITIRYLENIGANHYADDLKYKLQLLQD